MILKKLSILFVEDEDQIRCGLEEAISDEFDKFYTAKNGDEGLKKFKKYKPDIILADISMPIMDGLQMAQEVKALSKETPIVIMSAFSEKERLLRAIDVGIDKYIIKPIDPMALLNIIDFIAKEKLSYEKEIVINSEYSFNKNKNIFYKNGEEIALTKKELLFIQLLVKNIGSFVLHEDIKKNVWGAKSTDAAIRTFIKRIRLKTDKNLIINIPGLGYKLNS